MGWSCRGFESLNQQLDLHHLAYNHTRQDELPGAAPGRCEPVAGFVFLHGSGSMASFREKNQALKLAGTLPVPGGIIPVEQLSRAQGSIGLTEPDGLKQLEAE